MALAILQYEDSDGISARFSADIGRNRFFRYTIGDAGIHREGFPSIESIRYQSELFGPLPSSALGRASLEIPLFRFKPRAHFIQLTSFHDAPDVGPAVSDIVEVSSSVLPSDIGREGALTEESTEPSGARGRGKGLVQRKMTGAMQQQPGPERIPINIQLSGWMGRSAGKMVGGSPQQSETSSVNHPAYALPFTYREVHYSNAMFLQAIGSLLSSALPVIEKIVGGAGGMANLLGGLFGNSGGGNARGAAPNPSGANNRSVSPEVAGHIAAVLQALAAMNASGSAGSPVLKTPNGAATESLSAAKYSQQMIAPALLAAIPMLAPLLEKVMNPETINAVLNNIGPKATLGAVADAVKDIGGLNIQAYQNILDHIQKNMPSSDTTPMMNHLLAVSQSMSKTSILPSYRRLDIVQLQYQAVPPVLLRGRERIVFRQDAPHGAGFVLTVETPRPIASATLYLIVKDAETLAVAAEKQWDLKDIKSGALSVVPRLSPAEVGNLQGGKDYLVCSYLVWRSAGGERIGVSRTLLIHLIGEFAYQGLDTSDEVIPLNDVAKFRSYWHKIWQDSASREIRRWEWDCKYYFTIHVRSDRIERLQTLTEEARRGGRRIEGRMSCGLELSLSALNALMPTISAYPMLNEAQLLALSSPGALAAFSRAARFKAEFAGSEGDSLALWIYPEMRLQAIVLLRAGLPDTNGLVTEVAAETVHFPLPALCHFVGVTTATDPFDNPPLTAPSQEVGI